MHVAHPVAPHRGKGRKAVLRSARSQPERLVPRAPQGSAGIRHRNPVIRKIPCHLSVRMENTDHLLVFRNIGIRPPPHLGSTAGGLRHLGDTEARPLRGHGTVHSPRKLGGNTDTSINISV